MVLRLNAPSLAGGRLAESDLAPLVIRDAVLDLGRSAMGIRMGPTSGGETEVWVPGRVSVMYCGGR